jgi:hypothetical protein
VAVLVAALDENPAVDPLREVLLARGPRDGEPALDALANDPALDALEQPLVEALRAPITAHPHSIADQLRWAAAHWHALLPPAVRAAALAASDAVAEVSTPRGGGPGPAPVMQFDPGPGPENFSADTDWMPELVLMAKHTLVWLDQLGALYERPVRTLADIPDEALDELAARGFSGLWLIGLWERSPASRDMKRRMGNPEAEASAYSLTSYRIAERLGGDAALEDLRRRARARGIRLCADMVPNHTSIDSAWVVDHPERFVQIDAPPWDDYAFTGPDLSAHPGVSVRIEDGYWTRSGAAVVFQRVDHRTGEVRYLYHGNDGTQMPWNDTAQLDYTRADVREAVMQVILDVAARFDAIRFDAAMTLAKQHVQRLWHPLPGHGGAVPSRSRFAMSPEAFDAAMPREFWREVVERVAAEQPDTLLLAEAFWLLEAYFVRELGMHRVYNSAFMNMLRDEDNAGYRKSLKNVLEFSPAVLERFVNFVSNPDEAPAAAHFGKGDKYFGICTLLATLPGLPMFGHGQFEGFEERYGMEFARAYSGERPDPGFVAWHERVISPLLGERARFSGVAWFTMFDLLAPEGHVDEDVYAYANRDAAGARPSIVVYNNRAQPASGRLLRSAPFNAGTAAAPDLRTRTLTEALGLPDHGAVRATDFRTGHELSFDAADLAANGLPVQLGAYGCWILLDWRLAAAAEDDEVVDEEADEAVDEAEDAVDEAEDAVDEAEDAVDEIVDQAEDAE